MALRSKQLILRQTWWKTEDKFFEGYFYQRGGGTIESAASEEEEEWEFQKKVRATMVVSQDQSDIWLIVRKRNCAKSLMKKQ